MEVIVGHRHREDIIAQTMAIRTKKIMSAPSTLTYYVFITVLFSMTTN